MKSSCTLVFLLLLCPHLSGQSNPVSVGLQALYAPWVLSPYGPQHHQAGFMTTLAYGQPIKERQSLFYTLSAGMIGYDMAGVNTFYGLGRQKQYSFPGGIFFQYGLALQHSMVKIADFHFELSQDGDATDLGKLRLHRLQSMANVDLGYAFFKRTNTQLQAHLQLNGLVHYSFSNPLADRSLQTNVFGGLGIICQFLHNHE